jgi:RNA polymerase subunit RPABC4/transcription elongation factor Spt4
VRGTRMELRQCKSCGAVYGSEKHRCPVCDWAFAYRLIIKDLEVLP